MIDCDLRNTLIERLVSKFPFADYAGVACYVDYCITNSHPSKIKYRTEAHHVLPKNRGSFPEHTHDSWNIVHLTVKDHVIAHYILYKAIPIHSMLAAANMVTGNVFNAKMIKTDEEAVIIAEYVERTKQEFKEFMLSDKNPNIGKKRTPEQRKRLSEGLKRADRSHIEHRNWMSKDGESKYVLISEIDHHLSIGWTMGRRNQETRDKISKANTGRKDTAATKAKKSESAKRNAPNHHMKTEEKRAERSKAFTENNPAKTQAFRESTSKRTTQRWQTAEYRNFMSSMFSETNSGRIWYYNKELEKFRRFKPGDIIPDGFVNATGKLGWSYDSTGKRKKIYVETE